MKKFFLVLAEKVLLAFLRLAPSSRVPFSPRRTISSGTRCLILAPHPDDEILGCYYLLESGSLQNIKFDVAIVTDESDHFGLADRRFDESVRAVKGLNVARLERWGFADGNVCNQIASFKERLFSELEAYDYILSPAPNDTTTDHAVIASAVLDVVPSEKVVWYRSTAFTFKLLSADFIVCGRQQNKESAIRCYVTQDRIAFGRTLAFERWEGKACVSQSDWGAEAFMFADRKRLAKKVLNTLSFRSACAAWRWR